MTRVRRILQRPQFQFPLFNFRYLWSRTSKKRSIRFYVGFIAATLVCYENLSPINVISSSCWNRVLEEDPYLRLFLFSFLVIQLFVICLKCVGFHVCNLPISRALLRIKWVSVSFTHLRYITRISCSNGCVLIDHERNEWKKKKRIFLLCMRSTQLVVSRNPFLDFVAFFYHFTILYLSIINIWYIRSLYRSRELWKNLKIYRLQIFEKIVEWKESRIIAIY